MPPQHKQPSLTCTVLSCSTTVSGMPRIASGSSALPPYGSSPRFIPAMPLRHVPMATRNSPYQPRHATGDPQALGQPAGSSLALFTVYVVYVLGPCPVKDRWQAVHIRIPCAGLFLLEPPCSSSFISFSIFSFLIPVCKVSRCALCIPIVLDNLRYRYTH